MTVFTFTPPAASTNPPVLPEGDPSQTVGAFRLRRFYSAMPAGINVYIYKAGSPSAMTFGQVTEVDPITIYASGVPISTGWEDIQHVLWGGHDNVVVTAEEATLLTAQGYTVLSNGSPPPPPSAPVISSISPSSGIATTTITLTGSDFTGATSVLVDGTSATFNVINSSRLTFTAPTHVDGPVLVTVTTPSGTSNGVTFAYSTPIPGSPPAISVVSPSSGASLSAVTLTGTNFAGATSVTFGGTSQSFVVASGTSITIASVTAHADGAVAVLVTTSNGTSNSGSFTYTTAAPGDPHPGSDILTEDGGYILQEDGVSTIQQES